MDNRNMDKHRKNLLEERKSLLSIIDNIKEDNLLSKDEDSSELSSYDNHPSDSASEMFEMEKNMALEENEKVMLKKIDKALHSIENGTYGSCKMCGKNISSGRLEVIPYAEYCIDCQNHISSYENGEERPVEEKVLDYTFGYDDRIKTSGYDRVDAYQDVGIFNMIHNVEEYDDYDIEDKEGFVEPIEMISNQQYKNQLPH
ncbi:TraR/DksA C4-type zinc finger protein [Hathewaya histolytica]|uniref:Sporulation protein, yteA family n=1 Tax=Hathewaya histolytica TaxID=1498 RepID=A0A4U9R8T9_HATHI|nr:TraR/DksA C4-type zinc finger protein [Hathewaya histolytica]VTQ87985.1 sporulation protein, yteA family [Hathewaya histolytica]